MAVPNLNARQNAFVDAFLLNGGDKVAAAVDAGYSYNSAQQAASKLWNNPAVRAAIDERKERKREQAPRVSQPPPAHPSPPPPPTPILGPPEGQEGGHSASEVSTAAIETALASIGFSRIETTKDRLTALKLLAQMKGLLNTKGGPAPDDDPTDEPGAREAQLTLEELRDLDPPELERRYREALEGT